jgi:hypothetical protein
MLAVCDRNDAFVTTLNDDWNFCTFASYNSRLAVGIEFFYLQQRGAAV